jgi:amino acid adenylation domain-containing protein
VVVVREDEPGDRRLVAYIVPNRDLIPNANELRNFSKSKLPDYMVPSAFVELDALPLTPNGKVDRKALPVPDQNAVRLDSQFVAPRTAVEEAVAEIWAQVLRVERVGAHDSFFELGGHSLLATQVVFRARTAFGVELPLATFFEAPTVAEMAAAITRYQSTNTQEGVPTCAIGESDLRSNSSSELPLIVSAPSEKYDPFPLTDVQEAYWVGRNANFALGNVATHVYLEIESDSLDLERYQLVWQRLIERHDMLRAIILPDGRQQILEQVPPFKIETVNLRRLDSASKTKQLEAIRERMSHQVLETDQWPLFEIRASLLEDRLVRLHISADFLIIDAWSWSILSKEMSQLYQSPDAVLPPLEISFRDYVLAEIALRDSEQYRRSKDYWWNRLATLPPAPELPLAKDPGSISSPRFVRRSARLEANCWSRLKQRTARSGLTPSGLLLAVFSEFLKVWSKSPTFTINLTLFNRLPLHPQVNDFVGDSTSLTLLEVANSIEQSFEARAMQLQQQLWKDLDHSRVSGVRVMRELARKQGTMPSGVMPVVFTSIIGQESQLDLSATLGKVVYSISQTPQVWLDHQVLEDSGSLVFNWDAVEELFPDGMLDDMFESYCSFLRRLADDNNAWQETWPETAHKLLPVRQLEQRDQVNDTEAPITDDLLHTLFAKQVDQRPQQPAVISSERTLTYKELYRRANQIGHWLRRNGARRNGLVAVVMERGWEQVAGVLGVLASGAAYLPIDAGLPKDRLWHLLQHGEVELVLTQPHFDKKIEWPETVKRLTIDDGSLSGLDDQPHHPIQSPEDIAYVIYTSGSTGLPKGVVIDHRGAVNTILDLNRRFTLTPKDRVLALSSLSFDLSVYDIFGILAAGGTIVVPDAAGLRDPAHWTDLIARHRVTLWNSVPALMQMLVEYLEGRGQRLSQDLRLVFMSGDWIPVALPERILTLDGEVEIISMGGATEASIWSIIYPIEKVDPAWKSIPYGRPMVNQTFHVLNEALEPCPVWVPGQLYIGGIGLAKGYWRDEEKTRASFITHPRTGERLYHTGDQGRYLPDGNIEFLGRDDLQVKVQGYRIELGEIETILTQHPRVQNAVVAAAGPAAGNKRLVAYVVPEGQQASEVRQDEGLPKTSSDESNGRRGADEILRDPLERLKFKLKKPGMRINHGRASIQLKKTEATDESLEPYLSRRSYRKFANGRVSFDRFCDFLSSLSPVKIDDTPFPKYRYASAGGLYPVQTYLYIKSDRVEGLAGGSYIYDAANHTLLPLSPNSQIPSAEFQGSQAIFDQSAFALFFVGKLKSIAPMYGEMAREFCLIEAGSMCQLLETSAPSHRIGLCQIGGLDFQPIRDLFDLEESHIYLHCLLGGPISADQTKRRAFVEEMSAYSDFLRMLEDQPKEREKYVHVQPATAAVARDASLSPSDYEIAEELRNFLQGKLPEYMIPSNFVLLDRIPLSDNGKVDRKALPEPKSTETESVVVHAVPHNELEGGIGDIWREVLEVKKVGVQDNFFDVGGNSLHIVRIHAKIRERLKREIPIVELFKYTTIESLAAYLSQNASNSTVAQQGLERAQIRRASRSRRRQSSQQTGQLDD